MKIYNYISLFLVVTFINNVSAQDPDIGAELNQFFQNRYWTTFATKEVDTLYTEKYDGVYSLRNNSIGVDTVDDKAGYVMNLSYHTLVVDPLSGSLKWVYVSCSPLILVYQKLSDHQYEGDFFSEYYVGATTLKIINAHTFSYTFYNNDNFITQYFRLFDSESDLKRLVEGIK